LTIDVVHHVLAEVRFPCTALTETAEIIVVLYLTEATVAEETIVWKTEETLATAADNLLTELKMVETPVVAAEAMVIIQLPEILRDNAKCILAMETLIEVIENPTVVKPTQATHV
jgi:hypothetical protein